MIRDLSEQKELIEQRERFLADATEARAEAEQSDRAKDQFLITLSHELRTPLASILLWSRALLEGSVSAQDFSTRDRRHRPQRGEPAPADRGSIEVSRLEVGAGSR